MSTMRARKTPQDTKTTASSVGPAANRPRKKTRAPRARLTHFEIRRGEALLLRLAVADDAFAEIGDELGALIKRIAPSTQTAVIEPVPHPHPAEVIISREHVEHDTVYHAELRDHLVALFGSLCDTALEDALHIARQERDRRAEGGN
jgi:hypothetical protein